MIGRVLVVGAGSPLGGAVAARLDTAGVETIQSARSRSPWDLDILEPDSWPAVLDARPSALILLANPSVVDDDDVKRVGAAVTRFVDEATDRGTRRVVFASSSAIYGSQGRSVRQETDDPRPASPYARTKLRIEEALTGIAAEGRMTAVSLRIFNAFGPRLDRSLVNRVLLGDGSVEVYDSEDFVRDYVHAKDVAEAFRAAVDAGIDGHEIINVGTGLATSNRALIALPGARAQRAVLPPGAETHSVADVSRLRDLLGVTPTVTVAAAAADPEGLLGQRRV